MLGCLAAIGAAPMLDLPPAAPVVILMHALHSTCKPSLLAASATAPLGPH